jgi:8-oxo-dGTP pyrophosphatase MutT (NUDIX family)
VRWKLHGERSLYDSEWVNLRLVDVELPDGERFEHHVVRMPRDAAGIVVADAARRVLLLWRHRFITDSWGWEIPTGRIDEGETPEHAAAREAVEETGWRPGPLSPLGFYHPTNGLCDQRFYLFTAASAMRVGQPDGIETDRVEWIDAERLSGLIAEGQIRDGFSLTGILWALAEGRI